MSTAARRALIAVGCGLALLAVTCGGLATGAIFLFSRVPGSPPVREALRHAESDPRVVELLGTPLDLSSASTSLSTRPGGSTARFDIDAEIHGPRGNGRLSASATRAGWREPWSWERFVVTGGGERIDLAAGRRSELDRGAR
jgi:hypothetical protein